MRTEAHIRSILESSESKAGEQVWLAESRKALPYDAYTKDEMALKMRQVIASILRWVLEEETDEEEAKAKAL